MSGTRSNTEWFEEIWNCSAKDSYFSVRWLNLSVVGGPLYNGKAYGCSIQRLKSPADGAITNRYCYLWGRRTSDELDVPLLRSWLDECIGCGKWTGHEWCKPKARLPGTPRLVIDIDTKAVVIAEANCQCAALSYVWGPPHVSKLHHGDPSREPQGWPLAPTWARVPQIIKDANALCQLLSIPFLWVAALCIEEFERDLSANCNTALSEQMSNIYGGAHLTIVAAAGDDSWAGLGFLE